MTDPSFLLNAFQLFGDEVYVSEEYMDEKWSPSTNPSYYISDKGRVYSQKTGKIIKTKNMDREGHKGFSTLNNGQRSYHYLHREMAMAFLPKPEKSNIVRHLDDDKDNNHLSNLKWGTQKDNHIDSVMNGTYRPINAESRNKMIEKVRTPIIATNLIDGSVRKYNSQAEASRDLGIFQSNIHKVLSGKRSKTENYIFEYDKKGK